MPLDDPERDFLVEARQIMAGDTMLLPTVEHLRALDEWREVTIIRFVNALELTKQAFLNGKEA
jgi:hypothetical protein